MVSIFNIEGMSTEHEKLHAESVALSVPGVDVAVGDIEKKELFVKLVSKDTIFDELKVSIVKAGYKVSWNKLPFLFILRLIFNQPFLCIS